MLNNVPRELSEVIAGVYQHNVSSLRVSDVPTRLKKRFEYDGSGNCTYQGVAAPGTLTTEPLWLVQKMTYSGSNCTAVDTAFGAWDDRASLTYE